MSHFIYNNQKPNCSAAGISLNCLMVVNLL